MSRLSRRNFLTRSLAMGCSLAASPLVTPVTLASTPGDARLVVIILRGAMDGIGAVPPLGDPAHAALRPEVDALDLGGFYGMHPALGPLKPLWDKGELAFAHAVSTPYQGQRSHFDGQDMLEAGTGMDAMGRLRDGWLNRLLRQIPGAEAGTAYAVGRGDMLLLQGAAPVSNWSPDAALILSPQAERLLEGILHDDPLFRDAAMEALELSAGGSADMEAPSTADMMSANALPAARPDAIAAFAAERLREEARIAAFSLTGFDTHASQHRSLPRALDRLASAITTLQTGLGPAWQKTAVVAITEFGRTVRLNGSGGTDHGTAGAMIMAGGALRGGQVLADWPGLAEADLFERRDLRPTRDLRAHLAWMIRHLYDTEIAALERDIFPGLDMGADARLIL
ncbi:Tat (twin-arginine translocation) pathway signal sequence [Roseovarius nanhaiticus]|uniref:Tat (Twin-arginine translocation) pathway signal sequence n=1 Tax=Roseovarius nanhaiticus TaxID=573024 RepID=A0A1N7FZN3_9RHOB|nr:DUF1501 domain-containing protein [Roseovarius nanhaiticus]SEK41235.1 Tat (twin-arginine translocation) pathway signal sequence [Roseovarius nanhaiticus]SIS05656.1 Tat (twin-arginine translocation) pathway signal sequence [Roseovarius nanhaiticus]